MDNELEFKSDIDVELVQKTGGDWMVVASARVSTCGAEAREFADPRCERDNFGLINFLMRHRHGSCFEHGLLTFFVKAPIFVWREWHRHRIASYNEQSARYSAMIPLFYLPDRERPMMKAEGWKPGRPRFLRCEDDTLHTDLCGALRESYKASWEAYRWGMERGVDPGLARACLPVGIYSACWVTVNPRSLMNFLSLRTHEPEAAAPSYPLHEIELAARACERCLEDGWPLTWRAFCEHGRVAP